MCSTHNEGGSIQPQSLGGSTKKLEALNQEEWQHSTTQMGVFDQEKGWESQPAMKGRSQPVLNGSKKVQQYGRSTKQSLWHSITKKESAPPDQNQPSTNH